MTRKANKPRQLPVTSLGLRAASVITCNRCYGMRCLSVSETSRTAAFCWRPMSHIVPFTWTQTTVSAVYVRRRHRIWNSWKDLCPAGCEASSHAKTVVPHSYEAVLTDIDSESSVTRHVDGPGYVKHLFYTAVETTPLYIVSHISRRYITAHIACMLDRRFASCPPTTSVWQTSTRRTAGACTIQNKLRWIFLQTIWRLLGWTRCCDFVSWNVVRRMRKLNSLLCIAS